VQFGSTVQFGHTVQFGNAVRLSHTSHPHAPVGDAAGRETTVAMSSDRGTISRGSEAGGVWPEPTAPAGRRLPSAPRERKPALAALAVVLIVGGALLAAMLVIDAGHKTGAIEITQSVGQGEKIPASAMQEVQVTSGGGLDYVPWNQASQVANTYAATMLPAGTLLTPQMTTSSNNLASGMTVIGLALKDGELPDGLQVGDHVDIFATSDSSGRCPRPVNNVLTTNALVMAVGNPSNASSGNADDVQVAVNPGDAGGVSCNAANNNVSVGIISGSGQPGSGSPGSTSDSGSPGSTSDSGSHGPGSHGSGSPGSGSQGSGSSDSGSSGPGSSGGTG
jgi:hypothetical protein